MDWQSGGEMQGGHRFGSWERLQDGCVFAEFVVICFYSKRRKPRNTPMQKCV